MYMIEKEEVNCLKLAKLYQEIYYLIGIFLAYSNTMQKNKIHFQVYEV